MHGPEYVMGWELFGMSSGTLAMSVVNADTRRAVPERDWLATCTDEQNHALREQNTYYSRG